MNILIVGSGCREVCIIKKLLDDSKKLNVNSKIYVIANCRNPYILENCNYNIVDKYNLDNLKLSITKFLPISLDFAFIGPENPLLEGYADYLESLNIPCIGPLKVYAQIETSKSYCRNILNELNLSNLSPKYKIIEKKTNYENAKKIINSVSDKIVIKKDGLHSGKGVLVQDYDFDSIDNILNNVVNNNEDILIEEKLIGEEFSLMTLTCGNYCRHFPPIQDYKRLNNDDKGPNTGGMGALIDSNNILPFLTEENIRFVESINEKVINHLNEKYKHYKIPYRGILYGSFIICKDKSIKVIEYNSRFGDPECILALNLLETNFYSLCLETINNNLQTQLKFSKQAMICVYLVPKNYPFSVINDFGFDIYFNEKLDKNNIIFGNVDKVNNHLLSSKSRSLICFQKGDNLKYCKMHVYNNIKYIYGNFYYRNDIGNKFLTKYECSGVSIKDGENAVNSIKSLILSTHNHRVTSNYGSFGGEYNYKNMILVSSIDGVGTKSLYTEKIFGEEAYINLGKDLVNHSINDILVQGAFPLFFLDYFGCDNLNKNIFKNFINGVCEICRKENIALLGGETAELSNTYNTNCNDLVGCIIGYKDTNFFKTEISSGNIILGFSSNGPHTNGYSLIRKVFENMNYENIPENIHYILSKPHTNYINDIKHIIDYYGYDFINSMAHITGGGLYNNIKRVTGNFDIVLDLKSIENDLPNWCKFIMENGNISFEEMLEVFNCGIGYVVITNSENARKLLDDDNLCLKKIGFIN